MRLRWSRATSAGISPRWTASCRADSVWERRSVGARSSCARGTSIPALARWRTALASTTNLVIGTSDRIHVVNVALGQLPALLVEKRLAVLNLPPPDGDASVDRSANH